MAPVVWFYVHCWHPIAVIVMNFAVYNQNGLFILLTILVVLIILGAIFKTGVVNKIIGNICAIMVILIMFTCYVKYWPALDKYTATSSSGSTTTTTPTKKTTTTTTPTKTTTPTTTTTKQMYYGGGCSGCYANSCPRNGYSYGGWDVNMYNYYRSLCQACQCSSSRWQSLWR